MQHNKPLIDNNLHNNLDNNHNNIRDDVLEFISVLLLIIGTTLSMINSPYYIPLINLIGSSTFTYYNLYKKNQIPAIYGISISASSFAILIYRLIILYSYNQSYFKLLR